MKCTFLKLPEVSAMTGCSRSKIYADMQSMLFPSSIRLGARAVAWVDYEIAEWIEARIAGKTDDEIKALMASQLAAREALASV